MGNVERFAGKVAVITGGASGIGLATARRFVAEGARVVIGDVNADALAAAETELGASAAAVPCDVRAELGTRRIRVNAIGPGLVRTLLPEGMWLAPALIEEFAESSGYDAVIECAGRPGLLDGCAAAARSSRPSPTVASTRRHWCRGGFGSPT
jgi:NAD(P)-dependent dehydrogenase (short-subunit alcohol dehydrogenase family)